MDELEKKALEYHSKDGVPGKVSVVPTKPCRTAEDLALAYTPGARSRRTAMMPTAIHPRVTLSP